ncbi:uncharacterized protein LOC144437035 [Glandiceps talaboti]
MVKSSTSGSKTSTRSTRKQIKGKNKSIARRSLEKQYHDTEETGSPPSLMQRLLKKSRNSQRQVETLFSPQSGTSLLKSPTNDTLSPNENHFTADDNDDEDTTNSIRQTRRAAARSANKKQETSKRSRVSHTDDSKHRQSVTKITRYMTPKDNEREERERSSVKHTVTESSQNVTPEKDIESSSSQLNHVQSDIEYNGDDEDMTNEQDFEESITNEMNTEFVQGKMEASTSDIPQTGGRQIHVTTLPQSRQEKNLDTSQINPEDIPNSSDRRRGQLQNETASKKRKHGDTTQKRESVVSQKQTGTLNRDKSNFTGNRQDNGDVISHMADKEFVTSQVKRLSQPFSLTSGPLQWMQVWKNRANSNSDENEMSVPKSVLENAVRKLNHRLTDSVQQEFSRAKQRHVIEDLDSHRTQLRDALSSQTVFVKQKTGASYDELLDTYPMEWSIDDSLNPNRLTEEEMEAKAEEYSDLRAEVFALNRSVIAGKKEVQQYKTLLNLAKIAEDWTVSCNSDVLTKELQRTQSLLLQVHEKLLHSGKEDSNHN